MLEGLDKVDWNAVPHEGSSDPRRIPELLRNLLSQELHVHLRALADLDYELINSEVAWFPSAETGQWG